MHVSSSPSPPPPPSRKRPLSTSPKPTPFQQALRSVQTEPSLTPNQKAQRIHALYAERRRLFLRDAAHPAHSHNTHNGRFPGKGAHPGCHHYPRNCWLKAHCCRRFYPCRRCHDENEDHQIDRHATQEVVCVRCAEVQPVASHCRACATQFAAYFCPHCRFYDDTPRKHIYHCHGCGICRVGKGLGIDYHHCDICQTCVPIEDKDTHPCRAQSLDVNCPICTDYLKTSTEPIVFMRCGHAIHKECFRKHIAQAYTCPLCKKSLTDMSEYFSELDDKIANEVIPPEFARRRSRILCRDCDHRSVVKFHFVHHKCAHCASYNTQLIEYVQQGGAAAPALPAPVAPPQAPLPPPVRAISPCSCGGGTPCVEETR